MTTTSPRLKEFLDTNGIPHEVIHHRRDFTALEAAAHTHTPGKEFAKVVVVAIDARTAMVVLPAHHKVDTEKLRTALEAGSVRILNEEETVDLFPDCDIGAEPPFGNLYGMRVYLDTAMLQDERITFNAGTHEDALRMDFDEYRRIVKPEVLDFSMAP